MDDEPTYEYANPRAAAARFMRLYGERPGTVRGIDYVALSMASCNSGSHETHQDIALEKLDEFADLLGVFMRAFQRLERLVWHAWVYHRCLGHSFSEAATLIGVSRSTVRRHVGRTDTAVRDELVERQLVVGYAGRDLAHIEVEPLPRVQTWHNEEA